MAPAERPPGPMPRFAGWAPRVRESRVLVAGDVMLDRYWFGEVERISPEAPVPVVHISRSEERAGGAANVARNARALGAATTLLAITGDDEAAGALERLVAADDIATLFHRDRSIATTVKLRVIGRQQQLIRLDFETPPSGESLARKLADFGTLADASDVVVLSDYGKGALARVGDMIEAARSRGKPVLVDPKGDEWDRYRGATVLTPNRGEFRAVVGRWKSEDDMTARAQALRERLELGALLVTRSEEGMTLYTDAGAQTTPAQAREVFDVSGAGDTVIATLATLVAAGAPLADAVSIANRAAGIVVGKLGTAVVTPEELDR